MSRGVHGGVQRCAQRSITVYPWLPLVALATIDLVGDNREFDI